MATKTKAKTKAKPSAAPAFDPVKLSTVKIDRSEAVQSVMANEPDFKTVAEAYAYAAKNDLPASNVAQMYDVLQDAGMAEPVFSSGRKIEYQLGVAQNFYKHMPRTGRLADWLPERVVGGDEAETTTPVEAATARGTAAARHHLQNFVIGNVRRMLERLGANGQDVRAEAELFIAEVRRVVDAILGEKVQ
jgi:hypothetical protein